MDEWPYLCGKKRSSHTSGWRTQRHVRDLAVIRFSELTCADVSSYSKAPSYDRRISVGLERSFASPCGRRSLAPRLLHAFHQLVRVESNFQFTSTFQEPTPGSVSTTFDRQHNSSVMYFPSRYSQFGVSQDAHTGDLHVLRTLPHCSDSKTSSGSLECIGRQWVSSASHSDRMVSRYCNFPVVGGTLWPLSGRPFCHQIQLSSGALCVTVPGSSGSGSERLLDSLEQMGSDFSSLLFPCTGRLFLSFACIKVTEF